MLIKCPECNKEISDKAEVCIYCGYPFKKNVNIDKYTCVIDGIPRSLKEQLDNLDNPNYKPLERYGHEYGMSIADASTLHDLLAIYRKVPKEYNSEEREKYRAEIKKIKDAGKPHCPFCNSTDVKKITGAERAVSVIGLGLLSKKINKSFKCNKCGGTF